MNINTTKLRILRAEKNWTQGELAKRAGISQNSYSRIERGLQFPRYSALKAIASVYCCSVNDLIMDETRVGRTT